MDNGKQDSSPARFFVLVFTVFITITALIGLQPFRASDAAPSIAATYSQGTLHLTIPYHTARAGSGQLTLEVLDPEDNVLGRTARRVDVAAGQGQWQDTIKLQKALPVDDLVWHRIRYRFQYDGQNSARLEGTESISQILRTPVMHILGQQSYLAGSSAGARVIATDSNNEVIAGRSSVRVELLVASEKPRQLFAGPLNRRGTAEAQFRFPAGLVGNYQLHYVVDTPLGSTEFTQAVRLDDKVSILLTTEKPIYQPGQTIHVRALALDRSGHEAATSHKLTFELEDSRGNKVFKKMTETDSFGIASAEFGLADEVNLGTYHLRALMGDAGAPTNSAEIALNVERYVLPKFKVAVEFSEKGKKQKHGYQPGDHVTGAVRANYFFGKPVDGAEIAIKASAMDVTLHEVVSTQGRTDSDGSYHFDLHLPDYFAGRPLSQGAARVLIEATVKDSAGHAETRGEPITVSASPLLITAIPEGGTLVPNLENQVFILTAYPDGTPAKSDVTIHTAGNVDQHVATDDGGVAVTHVTPGAGGETLEIEAADQEGNRSSSNVQLQSRQGEDQIMLHADRAVYRAGDHVQMKVFSTKQRGAAYVDIVKEGQTVLTRDLDIENGQAELTLTATPEMAGTVDLNAYLFGRDSRPVGDHRLIFVQPADELKIETVADAPVYKPGGEAQIRFQITNSRGQGVHAALGLQVVDEAVFALAEKQPGFAKVFFFLEQEVMKPRYEIHSLSMPAIVEPVQSSQAEQRDRAARALFSATEIVNPNKLETKFGGDVPMTKYPEYMRRYQAQFFQQTSRLAKSLARAYDPKSDGIVLTRTFAKVKNAGGPDLRDAWGTELRMDTIPSYQVQDNAYYSLRSAGPDHQFNTVDDMTVYIQVPVRNLVSRADTGNITVKMEHDRGPLNGLAEIVGTVTDPTGAVVPMASADVLEVINGKVDAAVKRTSKTNVAGQFSLSGLPPGEYQVQVSSAGFNTASRQLTLRPRDRAVLSAALSLGSVSQSVQVTAAAPMLMAEEATGGGPIPGPPPPPASPMALRLAMRSVGRGEGGVVGGVPGGQMGGVMGGVIGGVLSVGASAQPAHVRSYFPEALYINPEIITDKNGHASIVVPIADSITTWRMAMIASTQHGALGTSTSSLKVFQDFFVDLDLPVTLTQGDRVSIPVAIYNYSGARGEVSLKLQTDDWFSLVQDDPEKMVEVDSGRVGASQFTLEAKRIGKFKLTLAASMKGQANRADIVVREIEVIPNGREQSQVFNGRLENSVQHEINFPANAIPDASKIFVRLYPGPLSQVVEGMDSLLRMPYGCFEQTSSSTYPNVLALDYMKRTKKLTPEVHAKAEGYISTGYQRLVTFEVPGGGFSWFGQPPANKILTAYGLMEFYDMSKVYDVDPKLISRTQQWLAGEQQADGSWKPDTSFINEGVTNRYNSDVLRISAYLAWSLENAGYQGPAVERARQYIESHMDAKMDAYTLAVVANFAIDSGSEGQGSDREFTRQAMQLLLDARTEKDEQAWWSADETGFYAIGTSASVETTGLSVQALLKWGQASGTARKALAYIAAKKDASGTWGTTQATIMALRALLLATEKGAADTEGVLEVLLNGKPAEKLDLTPENNDLLHQFVFKGAEIVGASRAGRGPNAVRPYVTPERFADASTNNVEIRFEGKGGLAYQIVGSYFLPWEQKPAEEPLSVDVAYDRTRLAQDDIATATATVKSNLNKTANMVMVDLGIPPGFDLLSEDLQDYQEKSASLKSGHLSKFSLTATQAILYFDSLAPGDTITVKFRLRAKYPIRARTFKSRVYEYYDPEVSSVAAPVQLEVDKR
ncbi:MAG: MG2 domain-containing protein [Terriglobia bacterium]